MILSEKGIDDLKSLIFDKISDSKQEKCMKCSEVKPNKKCKFIDTCERYGSFGFVDGGKLMVRDLFDTIEFLRK